MSLDEPVFEHSSFSQNSERVLRHEVAQRFFDAVVGTARGAGLLSDDHFTVDGTLIEAWASLKSVKPKDAPPPAAPPDDPGNPTVNFHGERRTNATHQSTTDPETLLARKSAGKEAKLCFSGHALMENRHGLCVDLQIAPATGTAERDIALRMLGRQARRGIRPRTLGADKGYHGREFVRRLRRRGIRPHLAQRRFLAPAFPHQPRLGIRRALMRGVRPGLAMEVHRGIAGIIGRWPGAPVGPLRLDALQRGPRLNQCAIHTSPRRGPGPRRHQRIVARSDGPTAVRDSW